MAVGRGSLMTPGLYHPVLDCFMRVLPFTYRDVAAEPAASALIKVEGDSGGEWRLWRDTNRWRLVERSPEPSKATATIPEAIAWRLFTKGITRNEAEPMINFDEDRELAFPILKAIAIVGAARGGHRLETFVSLLLADRITEEHGTFPSRFPVAPKPSDSPHPCYPSAALGSLRIRFRYGRPGSAGLVARSANRQSTTVGGKNIYSVVSVTTGERPAQRLRRAGLRATSDEKLLYRFTRGAPHNTGERYVAAEPSKQPVFSLHETINRAGPAKPPVHREPVVPRPRQIGRNNFSDCSLFPARGEFPAGTIVTTVD